MQSNRKISTPNDFPKDHKYMLIIFSTSSVYIPDDQRAIETHGAHGYPGGTQTFSTPEFYSFPDRESLGVELKKLYEKDRNRRDILVLEIGKIVPVGVSVQVDF